MDRRTNTAVWNDSQQRWRVNVQKDGVRRSFYSSIPGRNGQREANSKADSWLDSDIENSAKRISDIYDRCAESVQRRTSESNYRKTEHFGKVYIKPAKVKMMATMEARITELERS